MTRTAEIIEPTGDDSADGTKKGDTLSPFASEISEVEEAPAPEAAPAPARFRVRQQLPIAVMGVCASVLAGWFMWQAWTATPAASSPLAAGATGTAEFHSVPEGSSVAIDGTIRGVTPLRVALAAGRHSITLTSGSISRTIPITITPGGTVSQYVELGVPQAAPGGRLEIGSDPAGAQVSIDGAVKGRTPLMLEDVAPGQYRVTVTATGGAATTRTVNVTKGTTSTVVFSPGPAAADGAAGWLSIQAPVDMVILENGRVLGNTQMDRLMLPVGSHRLEFTNAALEFTAARTVQIAAGRTANVTLALPPGRLSVNAVPWAEVWLGGTSLGTTPLGDVTVPVGTHELVFRHPQLGERRQSVTVKAQTTARVGIDLRK